VVDDRPFAAELERRWHADLSRSRQVVGARAGGERRADVRTAIAADAAR
jgi:hypothetical protein